MVAEELIELGEQEFHHIGLRQLIPEAKDGGGIRHFGPFPNTEEPGEGIAVKDLVFHRFVGEVVKGLKDEDFEQQDGIESLGSCRRFARFFPGPLDEFAEPFSVHDLIELKQGGTGFVDA